MSRNDEIDVFFKLYLLLCADDTVILVESKAAMNAIYPYYKSWDLEVDPSIAKLTIFSNRKFQHNYVFTYKNQVLDIDENFVYLGIMFSYDGRFLKNNQRLVEQAGKAIFSILKKSCKLHLPIALQLQLFESMVAPILLYGSEITGFEKSDGFERLRTQFYKIILNLKKTTPNIILYGDLGRYPLDIFVKARMIGFWQRIIHGKLDKIAFKLYKILLSMHERDLFHSKGC